MPDYATMSLAALRVEVLALWNAYDAHQAANVEVSRDILPGLAIDRLMLRVYLRNGEMRFIHLIGNPGITQIEQWQLALDTLRKAADDMEARRNSAQEEK